MKYGFMTFSYPDADLGVIVRNAKEFGYDGVELRIAAKHTHGIELDASKQQLHEARSIADSEGIQLYSIATSFLLAAEPLNITQAKQTLELAESIGAKVIRVFGGEFANKGMDYAAARSNLVDGLKRFGDLSSEITDGVTIALESHDAWTDAAVLAGILEDVDQTNVGLNWDPFHIVRTMNMNIEEHFPMISKWVVHVHVHDGRTTDSGIILTPIGTGIVDHNSMLQCLKSINFPGYLIGEWIPEVMEGDTDPSIYLPRELAKLKKIEGSLS